MLFALNPAWFSNFSDLITHRGPEVSCICGSLRNIHFPKDNCKWEERKTTLYLILVSPSLLWWSSRSWHCRSLSTKVPCHGLGRTIHFCIIPLISTVYLPSSLIRPLPEAFIVSFKLDRSTFSPLPGYWDDFLCFLTSPSTLPINTHHQNVPKQVTVSYNLKKHSQLPWLIPRLPNCSSLTPLL